VPTKGNYYVYLLTNWNNRVIYIGITNNLYRRLYEHKYKMIKGFTSTYNVNKLVYFEQTSDVNSALEREKQLKKWRREKKDKLVASANPEWKDLSEGWY
jgi:putative endonuclease